MNTKLTAWASLAMLCSPIAVVAADHAEACPDVTAHMPVYMSVNDLQPGASVDLHVEGAEVLHAELVEPAPDLSLDRSHGRFTLSRRPGGEGEGIDGRIALRMMDQGPEPDYRFTVDPDGLEGTSRVSIETPWKETKTTTAGKSETVQLRDPVVGGPPPPPTCTPDCDINTHSCPYPNKECYELYLEYYCCAINPF